jgi:hypothetical protein
MEAMEAVVSNIDRNIRLLLWWMMLQSRNRRFSASGILFVAAGGGAAPRGRRVTVADAAVMKT